MSITKNEIETVIVRLNDLIKDFSQGYTKSVPEHSRDAISLISRMQKELNKGLTDKWISVDDDLPKNGQVVHAYYNGGNWYHGDKADGLQNVCKCTFIKGKTFEENILKSFSCEDQFGNNQKPYAWKGEGHLKLFGQDVSYWRPMISLPVEIIKKMEKNK